MQTVQLQLHKLRVRPWWLRKDKQRRQLMLSQLPHEHATARLHRSRKQTNKSKSRLPKGKLQVENYRMPTALERMPTPQHTKPKQL